MAKSSIRRSMVRRAARATARHGARGTASKLRRDPMRAVVLLGLGAVAGAVAGWLLARSG